RHLVGDGVEGSGQRTGVRHFKDRRHAAQHSGAGAGFEIFLVGIAGLAEMDLCVDHAGQQMQAPGVDHLASGRSIDTANGDRSRATLSAMASKVVVSGLVFGISKTAVTPPSTAAREPDSRSSLWVLPGSRKWTCVSITPGSRCRPRASITSPAAEASILPMVT